MLSVVRPDMKTEKDPNARGKLLLGALLIALLYFGSRWRLWLLAGQYLLGIIIVLLFMAGVASLYRFVRSFYCVRDSRSSQYIWIHKSVELGTRRWMEEGFGDRVTGHEHGYPTNQRNCM